MAKLTQKSMISNFSTQNESSMDESPHCHFHAIPKAPSGDSGLYFKESVERSNPSSRESLPDVAEDDVSLDAEVERINQSLISLTNLNVDLAIETKNSCLDPQRSNCLTSHHVKEDDMAQRQSDTISETSTENCESKRSVPRNEESVTEEGEGEARLSEMKQYRRTRVNDAVFRLHSKCTYTLLQVGRLIMLTVIKYYLKDENLDEFNAALTSYRKDISALSRIDKVEEHLQDKDVLFLYHVITRTKFIPSPKNGWGKNVDGSSIESSDDLERIRRMRNQIFHDPYSFSESVLHGHWCDLIYLVKRIDQKYNTRFHSFTQSLDDCCGIWKRHNAVTSVDVKSSEMINKDPYLELDKLVKTYKISTEESDAFKEIIKVLPRQHKVLYVQPFMSHRNNEKETQLIERETLDDYREEILYKRCEEDGNQRKPDGRPAKFLYRRSENDGNKNGGIICADDTIAIEIQGEKKDSFSEKEKLQATHKFITLHPEDKITLEVSPNCYITISKLGSLVLIIKCKDVKSKADLERKLENGSLGIVLKSILQNACLKMQIDDIDDIHVTLQEQSKKDDSFEMKDCPHLEFLATHENLFLEELCPSAMIECLETKNIDMTSVRQAINDYPNERLYHVSSLLSTLVKAGEEACVVFKCCLDCTGHAYLNEEWQRLQADTDKEKQETLTDFALLPSSSKPDPNSVEDVIIEDVQFDLSRAAGYGNTDAVRLLLQSGADVNMSNKDKKSPLHRAAVSGFTDVVRLLLQSGADVEKRDKFDESPLHKAARNGYTDVVRLLLECGADVNKINKDKKSPLHWAAASGFTDVVSQLLQSGADVKKTDKGSTLKYFSFICLYNKLPYSSICFKI